MISPVEEKTRAATGASDTESLRRWQRERLREAEDRALRLTKAGSRGLISERDIVSCPEAFLAVPAKEVSRIITLASSGTERLPKRIFFTEADLRRTADFFAAGMREIVSPGERALVYMPGKHPYTVGGLLKTALESFGAACRSVGYFADTPAMYEPARETDCLIGTPGQMACLCGRVPSLRPKAVLLSGEYVADSLIRRMERTWGCRVFTHWGMTETAYGGAVSCGCGGLHIRHEDILIEIIDPESGKQLPDGAWGEIVISTLFHEAMPLLHYRTGDRGRLIATECGCGGVFPRLETGGRLTQRVQTAARKELSLTVLDALLLGLDGICGYEAVWRPEADLLKIFVCGCEPEKIRRLLSAEYPGTRIAVFSEPQVSFTAHGKRQLHIE